MPLSVPTCDDAHHFSPFTAAKLGQGHQTVIHSVAKAIDILNAFTPSEPRLALGEVAHRLGLPKSTAHNLLATLVAGGMVERTDDDRYALGPHLIALTLGVRVNVELRDRAAPLLRELADACRDSVFLTIRDGDSSLYIYAVESATRLQARTAIGDRSPMHCTSAGKAILSHLPRAEVDAIVERTGMTRFTEDTITTLEELHEQLAIAKRRGFAIDNGEHETGIYCVGAPVFDAGGTVIGACSFSGPDPEILKSRLEEISRRVRYVAQESSRRIGYVPARTALVPPF